MNPDALLTALLLVLFIVAVGIGVAELIEKHRREDER